jgi:SAM-dependent methyltransferase
MLPASGSRRPPAAAGWALRRLRELTDPIALAAHRRRGGIDAGPLPPRRLRARTGAAGIREFADGGRRAADELSGVLAAAGLAPLSPAYHAVLDFGCGSARVLPHVRARGAGPRCAGCDVDPTAIGWASRHHPELELARSDFAPPLPFADRSFDLVYSISVFSHIDESLQDRWLTELRRVLVPGGVALLSVHGAHAFAQFRSGAVRTGWCDPSVFARGALGPDELVFVPYTRSRWNAGELPGVGRDYGLAFHGADYLRRHFSAVLEVLDVAPRSLAGWQDVAVCRRRLN